MLFMVKMKVNWPRDLDEDEGQALVQRERDYAMDLQKRGVWLHLWRTSGIFGNVSIFDVESNEKLHEILSGLPFFSIITMEITPLSRHPSRIVDPPLRAT